MRILYSSTQESPVYVSVNCDVTSQYRHCYKHMRRCIIDVFMRRAIIQKFRYTIKEKERKLKRRSQC